MELSKNLTFIAIITLNRSVTWNSTSLGVPPDRSVALVGARISIASSSLCMNLAVLIFHLFKPAYITDFTTYLLFLYLANSVYLIGSQPLLFWSEFSLQDIGSLGWSVCAFFNYIQRVVSIIPVMCHVLIALNRLWALQYPIHYRNKHNKRTAMLICLLMVGYVHIINIIPFFVYLPYRYQPITESIGNCKDTVLLMNWARADNCLNRFTPLFVIISVYIYLIIKRFVKKPRVVSAANTVNTTMTRTDTNGSLNGRQEEKSQRRGQKNPVTPLDRKIVRTFLVLTLTTAGVVVCWLVLDILYFCQWFLGMTFSQTVFKAFHMLYTLQILFDPVMWIVSLRPRGACIRTKSP